MEKEMIFPSPLQKGDLIAIIAPASVIRPEYVEKGRAQLEAAGFRVVVAPHVPGPSDGSYASSLQNRLEDLLAVLEDEEVKAVMCARGGYGCVQLLPYIPEETVRRNPKWLIGYSDISALHAFWYHCGVASIHGPMLKHLSEHTIDDSYSRILLKLLTESGPYTFHRPRGSLDRPGTGSGRLAGGNFAVLDGLSGTPFDIFDLHPGEEAVLFFEDIAEPIYKIDRMLTRLYLSGTLSTARGLIFGSFTEYQPDNNFNSPEEMISQRLIQWGISDIPVIFGFTVGHTRENTSFVEGASATITVGEDSDVITFFKS